MTSSSLLGDSNPRKCDCCKNALQRLCRRAGPYLWVPAGSLSRVGDVAVYVFDINRPSLPSPFYSVLVSVSVFMALSTVFHSVNFPDNSLAFSLCSSGLISALLVLSTVYLFMKVSLCPDKTLCGLTGFKHQLTN